MRRPFTDAGHHYEVQTQNAHLACHVPYTCSACNARRARVELGPGLRRVARAAQVTYPMVLEKLRGTSFTMLEIGTYLGKSIFFWKAYLRTARWQPAWH